MGDFTAYIQRLYDIQKKQGEFVGVLEQESKQRRAAETRQKRKENRNQLLTKRRRISNKVEFIEEEVEVEKKPTKTMSRLEHLQQWKAERERKKLEAAKKMKPIFKVHAVTAPIGLPDLENVNRQIKGKTFANDKSQFAPVNHQFKPPANIKPIYFDNKPKDNPGDKRMKTNNIGVKTRSQARKELKEKETANNKLIAKRLKIEKDNIKLDTQQDNTTVPEENKAKAIENPKTRQPKQREKTITKKNRKTTNANDDKDKQTTLLPITPAKITSTPFKNSEIEITNEDVLKKTPKQQKTRQARSRNRKNETFDNTNNINKDDAIVTNGELDQAIIDDKKDLNESCKTPIRSSVNKNCDEGTVYISPFVTIARGKNSARKEYTEKLSRLDSSLNDDNSKYTSPKAAASYFTRLLRNETSRIEEMNDQWTKYKETEALSEEAQSMIDVAIGQSKLLLNEKFQQFQNLIDVCRDPNNPQSIQCTDLHGFWDLLYIQIKNINSRFENLDRMKSDNWNDFLPENKKLSPKQQQQQRVRGQKKKNVKATSVLRQAIQAARKKKQEKIESEDINIEILTPPPSNKNNTPSSQRIKRKSVLNQFQNSERKLRRDSSPGLTMMKVTRMSKSFNTPNKGILKNDAGKSTGKSKAVIFQDDTNSENNLNYSNQKSSKTDSNDNTSIRRRSSRIRISKLF